MKKNDLKKLTSEEKLKQLNELRLELAKERAQIAIGGTESKTGKIRVLRKTIARLLTYLRSSNITSAPKQTAVISKNISAPKQTAVISKNTPTKTQRDNITKRGVKST